MNFVRPQKNIAYITLNGRIPSTKADSVAVVAMCDQFAQQGLDTILLVPGGQGIPVNRLGSAKSLFEYYAVKPSFEFLPFFNAFNARLSRFSSAYSLAMVLYARQRGFTLINTRSIEVAVWAARTGIPVILESHNFSKLSHHRMIESWVSLMRDPKQSVSMIVTTSAGRESYNRIGVPLSRIQVLPNGVYAERFQISVDARTMRKELGLEQDRPTIAFSGSLHHGRGGEEMLECAARLPHTQMLIIGGSSSDVEYYRGLARQRGIYNIWFTGHVQQEMLPAYLLAADVLLMPYTTRFSEHSFEYTSPMKMFEYLATGRPMVATDFPILHEVLEHGRNAIFVPPDSGEALAQGVRQLLENPALASQIGAAAKVDAQRYSWNARAASVIAWQRELGHLI